MPGTREASYSWTTINQVLGRKVTEGLLEMGSSSVQIAFVPDKSVTEMPSGSTEHVTLNKVTHKVYAHSYLCSGKNELIRRYYGKLLHDSNYTDVDDPCSFTGYNKLRKASDIFQEPCVKGNYARESLGGSYDNKEPSRSFWFNGTSNFDKCYKQISSMYSKNCSFGSCGVNGAFQPPSHGTYHAIGSAMFYSAAFANVTGKTNVTELETATKKLCSSPFNQVKHMKDYSEKYAISNCLADTYIVYLLKEILKYDGTVTLAKKIGNNKLSWTLGAATYHSTSDSFTEEIQAGFLEGERGLSNAAFIGLLVVGILLLVIAAGILMASFTRAKNAAIKTTDTESN